MAKKPGAKDAKGKYVDPAAAIRAGLMKQKSGELITPGKIAANAAKKIAKKTAAKTSAVSSGSGPRFTDYGLRRATNSLTKAEKQAEHKWRMKNDLDYKNQIAIEKAAKKSKVAKKPTTKK